MAAVTDIKTKKDIDQSGKTHMTVTWQTVLALGVVGLILGLIFAATRKGETKSYGMYAGIFAAFGMVVAALTQVMDVKALKTKEPAAIPADDTSAAKSKAA